MLCRLHKSFYKKYPKNHVFDKHKKTTTNIFVPKHHSKISFVVCCLLTKSAPSEISHPGGKTSNKIYQLVIISLISHCSVNQQM